MKKQVRDELAAAIGAVTEVSSRSITPVAVWVPDIGSRANIESPVIQVAPVKRSMELISRSDRLNEYKMQVGIIEPLDRSTPDATANTADAMTEAISNAIIGSRLPSGPVCTAFEEVVAADASLWREKRLYIAVLLFTFKR